MQMLFYFIYFYIEGVIIIIIVRTRFGLNPKEEWIQAYKAPNNKFVECGIKRQSGSRAKILDSRFRRKELYVHISTKSILRPALVSSPQYTILPPYYILWLFYRFLHPRVDQAFLVLFFSPFLPFLEPSILSCKAAYSLFRYHLHINTARRLAGQQLMRR